MRVENHSYRAPIITVTLLLMAVSLLTACQPLHWIEAPPTAETAEEPLPPLQPIAYAEGTCIDFGVYPDNTPIALPVTLNGIQIGNLGEPDDTFPFVNFTAGRLGLQFAPDGLRIDFGMPATLVTLEVASYTGQPVGVELFAEGADPVAGQEVTQEAGIVELVFAEPDMQALQLRGGGFEGMLLTLCVDQTIEVLSQVEIAIPYPPGITPPVGDAELVPGYAPIRDAVALLAEQLFTAGVQINTARAVLLKEGEIALPDRDGLWAETVAIAPIGPLGTAYANPEELTRRLVEGLVIGVLVMETDIPDTPLPSGAYIVQAQRQGQEGRVDFINAAGDTIYAIPLFAAQYAEHRLQVPIAAIYEGTKYCVSCYADGWCDCYPCSFWQVLWGAGADQCPVLLNQ